MEPKYRFNLNELGPIYLYANTPIAAYALLVSLSYRNYNEISNLLDKANTNGLDWAAHIIQILKATGKNTDSMEIKPSITLDNSFSTSSRLAADDSMDISLSP